MILSTLKKTYVIIRIPNISRFSRISFVILQGTAESQNLYDGMLLYGMWINHTLTTGSEVRDGSAFREFCKNKIIESNNNTPFSSLENWGFDHWAEQKQAETLLDISNTFLICFKG